MDKNLTMKDINEVDWQSFGASNVSVWLQDLQAEDTSMELYSKSYNELWQFLVPENAGWQDYLRMMESEVQYLIVPYLVDLLHNETQPSQLGSILELLESLARCWFRRKYFSETNPDRTRWERWSRQINDEVQKGIPIYQDLLTNPWSSVRENAQILLQVLEETQAS